LFILQKCLLLMQLLQQTQISVLPSLNLGLLRRAGPILRNATEIVCRIFPFRRKQALGVFCCFYFLFEHKPSLRALTVLHSTVLVGDVLVGCDKEAEWLHQCATECIQPISICILRPSTIQESQIAFSVWVSPE